MENYIINNKTVALLKKFNKTIIYDVDKVIVINKNIKKIIDNSCFYYGSSLKGRINCGKSILNIKYKVPIMIDESSNLVLIQLNSPRKEICLYLITNKIINYNKIYDKLNINCVNNINFIYNLSQNNFEKLLINSFRLNNVLNYRKSLKFL